jgi:hypothetical protein
LHFNSRVNQAEEPTNSEPKDKSFEITKSEEQNGKKIEETQGE